MQAFTIASLKVMHAFTGIWFVAGVIGRRLTQVRGRGFGAALDEAVAVGRVIDRPSAAFGDPVVRAAHIWELIALAAIVWLMISKPF